MPKSGRFGPFGLRRKDCPSAETGSSDLGRVLGDGGWGAGSSRAQLRALLDEGGGRVGVTAVARWPPPGVSTRGPAKRCET